jgi:hypothetical protein
MNINNIIDNDDMFFEVTSFLTFEDKIVFSKTIQKKCLRKYDFNSINFQSKNVDDIVNIYTVNKNRYWEYISKLCLEFMSDLSNHYDKYYGYNKDDFMVFCTNNNILRDYEYYFGYDEDEEDENVNEYSVYVRYEKYKELNELFTRTYLKVFARKIVENIENNDLSNAYYKYDIFELEDKFNIDLHINIHNLVIEYYKSVFENENINLFCDKCGLFGHNNLSKECEFHNIHYNNT